MARSNKRRNRKIKTRRRRKIQKGGQPNTTAYPPESIKTYISNVVYMNLDSRKDRKAEIESVIKIFNPEQIHPISAVVESEYPYLGCTKSHLIALKLARDNNWNNVLILEDDATWADIDKGYPIFEKLVKEPFDVIMLGGTQADYDRSTYRIKKAQSSASYLVNTSYYDTIIQKLEEDIRNFKPDTGEQMHIDVAVFRPLQAKDNWFIVAPALMIQRPSISDILPPNNATKKIVDYKNAFA